MFSDSDQPQDYGFSTEAMPGIEVMRLTSQDHVTKPTAILSGKKCTVAFVRVRVYVRFVAMGRAVALLGVQTGTRKVRI